MKKLLVICTLICAIGLLSACKQEQESPQYVDQYYCYDDDDGMEVILHQDGTVDVWYAITREHLTGTYQCEFPYVELQITESDSEGSEVSLKTEFQQEIDSLKFSLDADTLYVFKNDIQGLPYTQVLVSHSAFSHFLFKQGL